MRVINQPAHGEVIIREGRDYPNFPRINPRSACNLHQAPGTLVYYRPAPGYTGPDGLDIDIIYASGSNGQSRYNVVVK